MCGRKSRMFLCGLALALLLLPASLSAEEYYQITPEELTELETILTQQSETIDELKSTLTMQRNTLTDLSSYLDSAKDTLQIQETTISELRTSLTEYESEARVKLWTTSGISFGVGVGAGIIAYLILK